MKVELVSFDDACKPQRRVVQKLLMLMTVLEQHWDLQQQQIENLEPQQLGRCRQLAVR